MLACEVKLEDVKFPCYVSPKIDGCRCIVSEGIAYSRTLKPFPNKQFQDYAVEFMLDGDYEILVGAVTDGKTFERTQSYLMSIDKEINIREIGNLRIDTPERTTGYNGGQNQIHCNTYEHLLEIEEDMVSDGYEGIVIRYPGTPYKQGRSTVNEGCLLKYKRFKDDEAIIVDSYFLKDKNGKQRAELGAFQVKDLKTGVLFKVGSGFTKEERNRFICEDLNGKIIKYKYQELSKYGVPRFPVFLGFRGSIEIDLSLAL